MRLFEERKENLSAPVGFFIERQLCHEHNVSIATPVTDPTARRFLFRCARRISLIDSARRIARETIRNGVARLKSLD